MRAGLPGLLQNAGDGFLRHVAVEKRRAERAIGIRADQSGQRDFVGAPHRDHRHQADQAGSIAPRAERVGVAAPPRRMRSPPIPIRAGNNRSARRRASTARAIGARKGRRAASAPRRSLAHVRSRPCSMHDGPSMCRQCQPLPRIPVRDLCGRRRHEGRAWPSRSRGNAIGQRWKIPLSRSSDLSGRVNGSFSLIRRLAPYATSAVAGAVRNLASNSLAGIGRPKK